MTLLTRMQLNPARRQSRALLASPQAMHAAVLASFAPALADIADGPAHRLLWRVDRDASHSALLYVASPTRPDLTHLVEQAGWPTTSGWETKDYCTLLDRLNEGQRWGFRLTANPVRSVRNEQHPGRGLLRGHVTAVQQTSWLLERAERAGFKVMETAAGEPSVGVRDRKTLSFPRKGTTVTISFATFDGVLMVTDADLLRHTLTSGLGRAKSYGCGLLTLAPAA